MENRAIKPQLPRIARLAALLATVSTLSFASVAYAQQDSANPDESAAAQASGDTTARRVQVYTPADFADISPRNALDMVERIPGFSIARERNEERGLGQADQNVIVNGKRLSSKSDSIRDQLQRISAADVLRIEVVDGNTLDIPGLSGLVANVIHNSSGTTGQFTWRSEYHLHNASAGLFGGEASISGTSGALGYSVSLSNESERFGADGPNIITDGNGNIIAEWYNKTSGKEDSPRLSTNFTYDFGGETVANLNLSYGVNYFDLFEPEAGSAPGGPLETRDFRIDEDGPEYEIGADIEFPLGPGKLKLIGLEGYERENFTSILIDNIDDGSPTTGNRFEQVNGAGERIARFEYGWNMWNADWQFSGEGAFNRLDRASRLFELDPAGNFVELAFPAGTGGVTEDRYEAILSYSTQLIPGLSLQLTGGGEYSKIEQTGSAANARSFQRPKGSASLSWRASKDLDVSLELRRRVGQLDFGDFLASVEIEDDNANSGNNELQPDQSWNLELEVNKGLGAWGSLKLELEQVWFEDFIDFFPLPGGGEARGNIGSAESTKVGLNGTLKGEPIGFKGAQLDFRAFKNWTSVIDPFTGETRSFSNEREAIFDIDFRHDIPDSDWAWGGGFFTMHMTPYSRRFEVGRDYEGPIWMNLFVEHKDVFGLTVNAMIGNLAGEKNKFERTAFDGDRPDAPILFEEISHRRIGKFLRLSVSGSF